MFTGYFGGETDGKRSLGRPRPRWEIISLGSGMGGMD